MACRTILTHHPAASPCRQDAALATGLRAVLGRCRADCAVRLLLRVRLPSAADGITIVPAEADEACASSVLRFVAHVLPQAGMCGTELPIPDACMPDGIRDASFRYIEVTAGSEARAVMVREALALTAMRTACDNVSAVSAVVQ